MELNDNDRQRIEQEAKEAEKNRSMHDVYSQITPYVSGYILGSIIERRKFEAERSEVRNKVREMGELLYQCMQESDDLSLRLLTEIKTTLNSIRTK